VRYVSAAGATVGGDVDVLPVNVVQPIRDGFGFKRSELNHDWLCERLHVCNHFVVVETTIIVLYTTIWSTAQEKGEDYWNKLLASLFETGAWGPG
jgi:hypothetical protein